jgi:hypothetical protein
MADAEKNEQIAEAEVKKFNLSEKLKCFQRDTDIPSSK